MVLKLWVLGGVQCTFPLMRVIQQSQILHDFPYILVQIYFQVFLHSFSMLTLALFFIHLLPFSPLWFLNMESTLVSQALSLLLPDFMY